MTSAKLRYFVSFFVYLIVGVLIILLQSTGIMTLQIGTVSTVLILPLTVYAGFYFGQYAGAVYGLLMGALTDVYSSMLMYNTVLLTLVGFFAGVFITYLFNRNFAAACVLACGSSVLYFFAKWVVAYAFSDPAPMFILTHFSLPSSLYTAAFGVVMFFPFNLFFKKIPVSTTRQ